jgi:hypothetical protein
MTLDPNSGPFEQLRKLEAVNRGLREDIEQAKEEARSLLAAMSALTKMWRRNMLKIDLLNANKEEQISFYRMMLFPRWLSPKVRNAIIREFGVELGFPSVRAFNAEQNSIVAACLEKSVAENIATMKKYGFERGRRREAALEAAGRAMRLSANTVKVRLQRYRRLTPRH